MENEPQSTNSPASNSRGNSNDYKPNVVPKYPEYENWYADTAQYEAAESDYWRRQNAISTWGIVVNFLTLVAAIVAGCIAYNAFVQTKRQANEAKRQADAAEEQIGIASDTEKRQLRAYVSFFEGDFTIKDRTLYAGPHFKNSGQTPAYDLGLWWQMATQVSTKPFARNPRINWGTNSKVVLGPGAFIIATGRMDVPQNYVALLPAIEDGSSVAFMWGEIQYKDAFERTWCLEYRLKNYRNESGRWVFEPDIEGNRETNGACPNWTKPKSP